MKIALIDSGIGGLNTLFLCTKIFPNCDIDYLADTLYAPFGTQRRENLLTRLKNDIDYLINKSASIIILACNSATTLLIKDLAQNHSVPIIGVEPDIDTARLHTSGDILVFSTPITKSSKRVAYLVNKEERIKLISDRYLASMIEEAAPNFENVMPYFLSLFKPYINFEGIVLGCTHYLYLQDEISKAFPHIKIFNYENTLISNLSKYKSKFNQITCNPNPIINILSTKPINLNIYIKILTKFAPRNKIIDTFVKII